MKQQLLYDIIIDGDKMNKSTDNIRNKDNKSGKYTRLTTRIVISLILSCVIVYLYFSSTNNYNLLLLTDDIVYAIRSCVVIGVIGVLVVRGMEKKPHR